MSLLEISVYLLGAFGAWYIFSAIQAWYRLRHVPGPFLASFSYLWLFQNHIRGRIGPAHMDLRHYGSLVRNGPNYLVTDDPEVLRKLATARTRYTKDSWYQGSKMHADKDTMLSTLGTAEHDRLKSKAGPGYTGRDMNIEAAVDQQIERLISLIHRKYLSTKDDMRSVDFALISRYFTLDVISALAYGKPFGHLDNGDDIYGYCSEVDRAISVISMALDLPLIRKVVFSSLALKFYAPKPSDKRGVGRLMAVTNEDIGRRFEEGAKPRKDMMGSWVRNGLTKHECESEAILQVMAGSDTTATAIRSVMMFLVASPGPYMKLKMEIKQAIDRNAVSSPITQEQAQKLPYLQAVIWEGFRLRTPFTYGHYKLVPPEGDTINGIFIPGGTAIGHNTLAMARREAVFGKDVDIFRPERFLECSTAEKSEMERTLDMAFGGGRWTCAGKVVALMELNKVFFELLRAFDFQYVHPDKAWEENYNVTVCHTNVMMRITKSVL